MDLGKKNWLLSLVTVIAVGGVVTYIIAKPRKRKTYSDFSGKAQSSEESCYAVNYSQFGVKHVVAPYKYIKAKNPDEAIVKFYRMYPRSHFKAYRPELIDSAVCDMTPEEQVKWRFNSKLSLRNGNFRSE